MFVTAIIKQDILGVFHQFRKSPWMQIKFSFFRTCYDYSYGISVLFYLSFNYLITVVWIPHRTIYFRFCLKIFFCSMSGFIIYINTFILTEVIFIYIITMSFYLRLDTFDVDFRLINIIL